MSVDENDPSVPSNDLVLARKRAGCHPALLAAAAAAADHASSYAAAATAAPLSAVAVLQANTVRAAAGNNAAVAGDIGVMGLWLDHIAGRKTAQDQTFRETPRPRALDRQHDQRP